jgi:hypothetical protein
MWKSAYVSVYQLLNWKMHGETLKYHTCLIGLKYCCVDWTCHTYRNSGDQRCTFLRSSWYNFQCLLLQIKICTLSHSLTLQHQHICKSVPSMTDHFTLAQHRFCTLNSCYYGVGCYWDVILLTFQRLWCDFEYEIS